MNRDLFRRTGILITILAAAGALPGPGTAADEEAEWTIFSPIGDVMEIALQGTIAWVGAEGGLVRIDLATVASGSPTQRKITDQDGLVSPDITCLTVDGFGNVWVGTRDEGVSVFDANGSFLANLDEFDEIWSDFVLAMGGGGDRVFVASADEYSAQGTPEGGGFVMLNVTPLPEGGFAFEPSGGVYKDLERVQEILVEENAVWFGTSGLGLWKRDESVSPATLDQVFEPGTVLLSPNVKKLVRAKAPDLSGEEVLWIGTAQGLQTFDGTDSDTVSVFEGSNILDLYEQGDLLYVLAEDSTLSRDLYRADLTTTFEAIRIPRNSECAPDTLYVPREVAVDTDGRIVLGTLQSAFFVREGVEWTCPPPLGPHNPFVSDLALTPGGTLFFGTGHHDNAAIRYSGVGMFSGGTWGFFTRASSGDKLVFDRIARVAVSSDSVVWFGSSQDRFVGGLNRFDPRDSTFVTYHDTVPQPQLRTQGKNVQDIEVDAAGNVWVVYGQVEGGVSVIDPDDVVTNYPIDVFAPGGNEILRSVAFDSRGRLWVTTKEASDRIATLFVIDPKGTIHDLGDDSYTTFLVASQIADLGTVLGIAINSADIVWLAGTNGLVRGEITADDGGQANATWTLIEPTLSQTGGRNPLPYTVAEFDWDENLWLGTESSGLVRLSDGGQVWTWFDQEAGHPLPDQSVQGLFVQESARALWVSTASGSIARLRLTGGGNGGESEALEIFPNPWRPKEHDHITIRGIPEEEITTLRIFTLGGELVHEVVDLRNAKTWDGLNLGGQLVEAGVYLVTAVSTNGNVYEGKVAVIR